MILKLKSDLALQLVVALLQEIRFTSVVSYCSS